MTKKLKFLYLAIVFIVFFSLPVFALPAQDVEVVINKEYFPVVHEALKKATTSIQLMMFEAAYYEEYPHSPSNILIKDLLDAKRRGVEVEVILERGKPSWRVTQKNKKVGQILSSQGIKVAYDPEFVTTHVKLLIIDNLIILGSTNWTYYSLTRNNEVSALIKSKEVAQKLSDYFQRIWKTCQHEREG